MSTRIEELKEEDKQLIKLIAEHFKFSLGDALEVFRYAQYRSDKKHLWIGSCEKAVSIEKCREILKQVRSEAIQKVLEED